MASHLPASMNAAASRVPTPVHSQAIPNEVLLSMALKRSGPAAEPPAAPVRTIPKALVVPVDAG
jgi:hypothetical protein